MFTVSRRRLGIAGLLLTLCAVVVIAAAANRDRGIPVSRYRVVAEYPHDPQAFTQGLMIHDGKLYEGTGLKGRSSLRRVDLETGQVETQMELDGQFFGEGVACCNRTIYQLTWQNRTAILYQPETLEFVKTIRFPGEGWGLTSDGKQLILSDGTSTLKFLDPATLEVTQRLPVKAARKPVKNLNELEFIQGEIWANIWYSDRIARINPQTGEVVGWIDLSALYPLKQRPSKEDVLNGIAYDAQQQRIFVTGKHWPKLYEIELVP